MRMLFVLSRLAWRYLWRNHRRTIVMLGAISIGAWAMIFMTALTRGMVDQMVSDGISVIPGHVQIHNPDYLDDPSIANRLTLTDEELTVRFTDAGFDAWASRVRVPAVITSERDSRGVTMLGIDPDAEREFSFVDYDEVYGRFLESSDDKGVVIGAKLADTQIYEDTYVFIGKRTAQKMLRIGDTVSEVVFVGNDYRNVEPVFEKVSAAVDDSVKVSRWTEVDTYLGTMLGVMDGFMLIWVVVIFLALSFGLVNTLVMAVFERVREIGLMLALGMKPMSILGQIIIESMMLLAVGLLIGNVLAFATVKPLESGIDISIVAEGMEMFGASSVLYPKLYLYDVILSNVVVLVLGFLASLSPAWRASRYEPVEAITKV
jgi:ABC-type lipoprotein release transport system permease subunit